MTYRRLVLTAPVPSLAEPAAVPLLDVSKDVPHETQRALDTQPGTGGRVLGRYSLDGATSWLVPDGDDTTSGSRIYPDATTPRVVLRLHKIELSPGSLVRLDVVAAPSGPTQRDEGGAFVLDSLLGRVRAVVTYRAPDGSTADATAQVLLPPSQEQHGGEPQSVIGSLFAISALALPGPLVDDAETWADWTSVGVSVDVRLELLGSPRIVDVALVEHAFAVTVDTADAWPSAMYVDDSGQPLEQPPSEWPQTQASASDKGFGVEALAEAIAAHGDLLGGPVIWWSSATEHVDTLADWLVANEAPPFVVTGTTAEHLSTGLPEQDELPAWTTGSHAAALVQSGDAALVRRTAVVPVWIAAYMRVTSGGTGYTVVKTSDWDSYELSTTSPAFDWVRVPGWLEVGANPEDDRPLRVFPRASAGGLDCDVRYVAISRRRSS
jgi:hypothetical protein